MAIARLVPVAAIASSEDAPLEGQTPHDPLGSFSPRKSFALQEFDLLSAFSVFSRTMADVILDQFSGLASLQGRISRFGMSLSLYPAGIVHNRRCRSHSCDPRRGVLEPPGTMQSDLNPQ